MNEAAAFMGAEDFVTVFKFWDGAVGVTHTPKVAAVKRVQELEKQGKPGIPVEIVAKMFTACEVWPGGVPEQLVATFSDRVCKEMKTLQPDALVAFTTSLGSSKAIDEFWMFFMAKRIQETVENFHASQLIVVAEAYALRYLEDDLFFKAIVDKVSKSVDEVTDFEIVTLMLACANVRFRDESSLKVFYDRLAQNNFKGVEAGSLSAAADLDYHDSRLDIAWKNVCPSGHGGFGAVDTCSMGGAHGVYRVVAALLMGILHHATPAALDAVPAVLRAFDPTAATRKDIAARLKRRWGFVALSAELGMIPNLNENTTAKFEFREILRWMCSLQLKRDDYMPASSGFHLEVASLLKVFQVPYEVEAKQFPFMLDLLIRPGMIPKPQAKAPDQAQMEKEVQEALRADRKNIELGEVKFVRN